MSIKGKYKSESSYAVVGDSTVITARGLQMDVAVQLSPEHKNTGVRGLLGNFNDDPSDDFISRNGETLDASSNEETIHYKFGETCELMSS